MNKKYEILKDEPIKKGELTLYHIEALKDFGDVKKGDIGGLIEKEENLSHEGDCWIDADTIVCGDAKVYGNAIVHNSIISFNTEVYDNAKLHCTYTDGPNIKIYGNAQLRGELIRISEDTDIYGNVAIDGYAFIGNAELFGHTMIESCSILGYDNEYNKLENRIIIGSDELISLDNATITSNAKIVKDSHYGIIRGLGLGSHIEFYKSHDDDILVSYDSRYPITIKHFKEIAPMIIKNHTSLISFIENTINDDSQDEEKITAKQFLDIYYSKCK